MRHLDKLLTDDMFEFPRVEKIDRMRHKSRHTVKQERLIFDCTNAEVGEPGTSCPLHDLNKINLIPTYMVLRGYKVPVCQECSDYNDDPVRARAITMRKVAALFPLK